MFLTDKHTYPAIMNLLLYLKPTVSWTWIVNCETKVLQNLCVCRGDQKSMVL